MVYPSEIVQKKNHGKSSAKTSRMSQKSHPAMVDSPAMCWCWSGSWIRHPCRKSYATAPQLPFYSRTRKLYKSLVYKRYFSLSQRFTINLPWETSRNSLGFNQQRWEYRGDTSNKFCWNNWMKVFYFNHFLQIHINGDIYGYVLPSWCFFSCRVSKIGCEKCPDDGCETSSMIFDDMWTANIISSTKTYNLPLVN